MTKIPYFEVDTGPDGSRVRVREQIGDVTAFLYLSPDEARAFAAQLQAAANTATSAPVIHQREAVQP